LQVEDRDVAAMFVRTALSAENRKWLLQNDCDAGGGYSST